MLILGLHLGHDASASLISEDRLISSILQERITSRRHDFGLNIQTVDVLLKDNEITLDDIDYVAVTSTQLMPAIIQSPDEIKIEFQNPGSNFEMVQLHNHDWLSSGSHAVYSESSNQKPISRYVNFINTNLVSARRLPRAAFKKYHFFEIADPLFVKKELNVKNKSLLESATLAALNYRSDSNIGSNVISMNHDLKITIRNREFNGRYWSHHATHAMSNAIFSTKNKLILTHDGGVGHQSGGLWMLENSSLNLLATHEFEAGQLYDYFAYALGLGSVGGAGKLMGLAAYGEGKILPANKIYATKKDLLNFFNNYDGSIIDSNQAYDYLWHIAIEELLKQNIDVSKVGIPDEVTNTASVEMAHFAQRIVQNTIFDVLSEIDKRIAIDNLGLSGGVALNCPTNSKIYNELSFKEIDIEPHCEDGGCSIGAAGLELLKVTGKFVKESLLASKQSNYAYMGQSNRQKTAEIVNTELSVKIIEQIVNLLIANKTVGIFFDRSEVGPRALGHRSILANATYEANWQRVNELKGRETWRPFAPVILEEDLYKFFENGPAASPFMLFNYRVKNPELVPAICHVDQTSRVQTISRDDKPLYEILSRLKFKGQIPVLLNTSLNGPGEPILEYESQAKNFFMNTKVDAMLINDYLYVK